MNPEIIVCAGGPALARCGAERFVSAARAAIMGSGRFAVALSGGSTPKALYALLAAPEFKGRIDWPRVHLFWGDERCVPPDHKDSNFRMAREAFLERVPLPERNVHRMAGEQEPQKAAGAYEAELRSFFGARTRFDLILLGLGEDGHTASIFPGSAALNERERLVAAVHVERLRSHRLTLTFPVLNTAARILFLVAGAGKKEIVDEILRPSAAPKSYPAAQVQPSDGVLTWLLGADAAAGLPADFRLRKEE